MAVGLFEVTGVLAATDLLELGRVVFLFEASFEKGQNSLVHERLSSECNIDYMDERSRTVSPFVQLDEATNKIIMLHSPVHPARLNPEFIGIATQFSTIKKNRTSLQQDRDQLIRRLHYRIAVDRTLDKTLHDNKAKLNSVRSVHRRHQHHLQEKRERQQRQRRETQVLNRTVQLTREQQRLSIREAVSRTQSRNRQWRAESVQGERRREGELRSAEEKRLQEKQARFKQIKQVERNSQRTVHEFHRHRNAASLHHYQTQIEQERSKYLSCAEDIQHIESSIDHYDTKIGKKKEKLMEVMDEISFYTQEPLQAQSRCLPLYLRQTMSTSLHSSKPSAILLKGPASIISSK